MTVDAPSRPFTRPRFRRILMALDPSYEDVSSVEAAAALAAQLQAELLGLFVEDIDLVRLAEHPEISAYSMLSAGRQRFAAEHLKRALRTQMARSRQAVEAAAARRRIKFAFQVRQGRLVAEVTTEAGTGDLVVVGWSRTGIATAWPTSRMGAVATARAVAEATARSVLLLRPETPSGGPVLVAYDGSDAAGQAVAMAADIAAGSTGAIEVALLSGRIDQADTWRREITTRLAEAGGPTLRFVHMPKAGLDDLCKTAEREAASLLVLAADLALDADDAARRRLERLDCSLLLVHQTS
ncbi:MAG: hypothetical protein ACFCUO_08170 [Rhodospirillales bacterium]